MRHCSLKVVMAAVAAFAAVNAFAIGKKTAKSYVTSGLILQFDAIANNGWSAEAGDIHAQNASLSLWKELVANTTMKSVGTKPVFYDTYVNFPHNGAFYSSASVASAMNAIKNKAATVELFIRPSTYYDMAGWFQISNSNFGHRYLSLEMGDDTRTRDGATYTPAASGGSFERLQYLATAWGNNNDIVIDCSTDYLNQDILATIVVDSSGAHLSVNNGETIHTNPGKGDKVSYGYVGIGRYSGYYASGRIYAVRMYNRVLTAEERATNYSIDRERFLGEGATVDLSFTASDAETLFSFDGETWGAPVTTNDTAYATPVTIHAKSSLNENAYFVWTGLPSGATFADERKSSVTFTAPAKSSSISCRAAKVAITAASTDGETEFSLDGTTWSQPLSAAVYSEGTPLKLYARNPNFEGATFAWDTLPTGATASGARNSEVSFSGELASADFTCHAVRNGVSATASDANTEISLDGENWVSSLSLQNRYVNTNITIYARNTSGEDWAYFAWEGLPSGTTGDPEHSIVSFVLPEGEPLALSVGRLLAVTNTYSGGTGNFEDETKWSLGVVPAPNHDLVIPAAALSGETNVVTVNSAFSARSLTLGGGGEGTLQVIMKHAAFNTVVVDCLVKTGTTITHTLGGAAKIGKTVNYAVRLNVGGNMTIESGAKIDVTGKGHIQGNGPWGQFSSASVGSSHGGADVFYGGKDAYDSALKPCMYGSSQYSSGSPQGGGIVRLTVGGALVVNGGIRADGTSNPVASDQGYGGAAGGAIWLTAGTISGAGRISTDGGSTQGKNSGCCGCGGRIAIYQTALAGTDFTAFTGQITSYGGSCQDTTGYFRQRQPSSAGTIYLQAYGETVTNATLIVDNYHVMVNSKKDRFYAMTPLSADFDTGEIGNLIVRNCGQVAVSNRTVKIHGNLTVENNAKFQTYKGTLEFVNADQVSTIRGTNLFNNVSCTTPGKTLKFGTSALDNFRIANGAVLTLHGASGAPIVLTPAVAGEDWKLTISATGDYDIQHVTVDHSNASGGNSVLAYSSTDAGNNQNWTFPRDSEPGDPITWTGASSTTWADSANWVDKYNEHRLPLETDVVTIPGDCQNYPIVIVDSLFNSLQIASDASLTVNGSVRIDVTNSFTNAGTLNFTGAGKAYFSGTSLDFTGGTVNAAMSAFNVVGDGAQTLNFGDCAFKYFYMRKSGGSASVLGGLSADIVDIYATNNLSIAFAQGVTLAANNIFCRGRAVGNDLAPLVLTGATQGDVWYVNASRGQYFGAVTVRDCTAAGLPARAGSSSVDLGGHVNWTFDVATAEWIGGTGDFDTAANWYPAVVPGSGTDVLVSGISASGAATASGAANMRSLIVGGGAYASSLRVNGLLTVAGDVEVRTNGTLVLNNYAQPNSIGNDLIVRRSGKVTHTALGTGVDTLAQGNTANKLILDVARDVVVDSGGTIDVNACGYSTSKGPMSPGKWFTYDSTGDGIENVAWTNVVSTCAGHASSRTMVSDGLYKKGVCYGSMFEPFAHGSGGQSYAGGGVIKAIVHRNMTVNGVVSANGGGDNTISSTYDTLDGKNSTGAGGSVWLDIAGTLSGSGHILARGGGAYDYAGGGGRVAIYYGEDAFAGVVSAESREYSHSLLPGGGTVLKKCKTSRYYDVTINCDEARSTTWNNSYNYWTKDDKTRWMTTDIPSSADKSRISLFKDVRIKVGYTSVMNLTQDLKIYDLQTLVNTGSLVRLNSYTLKVISNEHKDGKGWGGSVERCTRKNGEIVWCGAGFAVTVR